MLGYGEQRATTDGNRWAIDCPSIAGHLIFEKSNSRFARLGHRLDVRGELSVQHRMHRETRRLGGSLDLARIEVEARLHVGAGDRKYRPPGQLRRHRAVDMARNNSPHLRVML